MCYIICIPNKFVCLCDVNGKHFIEMTVIFDHIKPRKLTERRLNPID